MHSRHIASLALVVVAIARMVSAVPATDYSLYPHWNGTAWAGQQVTSVHEAEIFGVRHVMATCTTEGLGLFRETPDGLAPVGEVAIPGIEVDAAVSGWYAHVAVGHPSPALVRVSLAVPSAPSVGWQVALPATPLDMVMIDSVAFLACGPDGVIAFDVTEQFGYPVGVIGQWTVDASAVARVGDHLCVLGAGGLHILDVLDAADMTVIGHLDVTAGLCLAPFGAGVAVAHNGDDVLLVDLADPAAPIVTGSATDVMANHGAGIQALAASSGHLLAANLANYAVLDAGLDRVRIAPAAGDDVNGLLLTDLGILVAADNGLTHIRAGSLTDSGASLINAPESGMLRAATGSHAFLGSYNALSAYRLDGPASSPDWTITGPGAGHTANAVAVNGDRLAVAWDLGVFEIRDLSQPIPAQLGLWTMPDCERVLDATWYGSRLIVAWDGPDEYFDAFLSIVDVSDPADPVILATAPADFHDRVVVADDVLVAWSGGNDAGTGIQLYDLGDPGQLTAGIRHPVDPLAVVAKGRHLFVLKQGGGLVPLEIVNASTVLAGDALSLPYHWASRAALAADTLYLDGGRAVVDVADPMTPRVIGSFAFGVTRHATGMAATGDHLVLTCTAPVELYRLPLHGSQATAAPDDDGPPPAPHQAMHAAPNPFNPRVTLSFAMPHGGAARLEFFDARGRRVATRNLGALAAGPQRLRWDGRDDAGRTLPSGAYLARVRGKGLDARVKVMLAK